jgi:Sulfotransferase domain
MPAQLGNADIRQSVEAYYQAFRAAHKRKNFGDAYESFAAALTVDADRAYRYFITRASALVEGVLRTTGKTLPMAAWLNELITRHPNINLLCDDDPAEVDRVRQLREVNIQRGLPSVAVVAQGKSASVAIGNIFSSGFNLPCFAYSLNTAEVIESWARDFARGGAAYTTHLRPYKRNISRFKRAGVRKIVVQVRDPRQRLLSLIHHVLRYDDAAVSSGFAALTIDEQAEALMEFYLQSIDWIEGWVDAEKELDILFSTFEDFVRDRDAFVQRYLDFYGGPMEYFRLEHAINIHDGVDYHFRSGQIDEWKQVFSPERAERLSAFLPRPIKQRFGWSD